MYFGVPYFTDNNKKLMIPYVGTGNPTLTSDLTTYAYSLDGTNFSDMTPSSSTSTTGLDFIFTGSSLEFEWEIKTDLRKDRYNNEIHIRFQATSGDLTTAIISKVLYFEKYREDQTQISPASRLPKDYSGIPGGDLLEKAPKIKKKS